MKLIRIILPLALIPAALQCDIDTPSEVRKTGNFSNKRAPSSNFGFGQNILSKHALIYYTYIERAATKNSRYLTFTPTLLYGISSTFSVFAALPLFAQLKSGDLHGKGVGDMIVQLEYAWYTKLLPRAINQATIVANVTFPTAYISPDKQLEKVQPAGNGTESFFIGFTASHVAEIWIAFISDGATITLERNGNKVGNSFLYQGGIGRFIAKPLGVTMTAILEVNGTYSQKSKNNHTANDNSGGNSILMGPSLFFCGKKWQLVGGLEFPILQRQNGTQAKQKYSSLMSISYEF